MFVYGYMGTHVDADMYMGPPCVYFYRIVADFDIKELVATIPTQIRHYRQRKTRFLRFQ